MDDLQLFIKSVPRGKGLPYLEHYPASADLFPSELKDNAYPDGVLPVPVDMSEMATVLGSSKMRGRPQSKNTDKSHKWLQNIPEEHRSVVMAAIKKEALPISTPALPSSGSDSKPAPIADTFRFNNPPAIVPTTKVKHEPNDEDDNDEVDEDDDCDDDIADPNTIDDLERTFLAARSGVRAKHKRDLKKRPAASEDVTAKERPAAAVDVMRRPATAVAVMKRPSAALRKKPASGLVKSLIVKNHSWKKRPL